MTYKEALEFLSSKQFQTSHGRDYYGKIRRVDSFFAQHGRPDTKLKVILVGGTAGKGSTCYYIARLLRQAGLTVGLHVSPHLQSRRERIQINEELIEKKAFADLVSQHAQTAKNLNLSYPEFMSALAVTYFAKAQVDYAVVEVGLGGRYDPTNSLDPLISVITNIGHDHLEKLGDNPLSRLRDKFGIVRPNGKLVTAINQPSLKKWVSRKIKKIEGRVTWIAPGNDFVKTDLALAQAVVKVLGLPVSEISTAVPGRFEWLTDRLLIDCAHNPTALRALKKKMEEAGINCKLVLTSTGIDLVRIQAFIDSVHEELSKTKRCVCATGSVFAVGALRDHYRKVE